MRKTLLAMLMLAAVAAFSTPALADGDRDEAHQRECGGGNYGHSKGGGCDDGHYKGCKHDDGRYYEGHSYRHDCPPRVLECHPRPRLIDCGPRYRSHPSRRSSVRFHVSVDIDARGGWH